MTTQNEGLTASGHPCRHVAAEGRIILTATNEVFRLSCSDDCFDVVKERGVVPCHDEEYGYGEDYILAEILMFH